MPRSDTFQRLKGAEERLTAVTDALQGLNSPAREWAERLGEAAHVLESIRPAEIAPGERARTEQVLSRLAAQAATAKTLLDSAAALYFGRVLSQGAVSGGYLADGAADSFGGGGMQIHG